jgi:hypothetical protein
MYDFILQKHATFNFAATAHNGTTPEAVEG